MSSSLHLHALPLYVGGSHISPIVIVPPSDLQGIISSSFVKFITWSNFISDYLRQPLSECNVMLVSGAIAGICSRTVTAPLDRIKVAIQAGIPYSQSSSCSLIDVSKAVYSDGGWKSFFRGNGVNVIKVGPETASKFFIYEKIMSTLCTTSNEISAINRFAAGSIAGVISQTLIYPLEIAKTRFSLASPGEFRGIAHCLQKISSTEGFSALYRGLGPSLMGIIPYAGVDLAVFNTLKHRYVESNDGALPPIYVILGIGAVSSTCGQSVSYPLQLIRTKLQAQGVNGRPQYFGARDCLVKTFEKEGFVGLYRGILPNFAKTVPSISISYAVYETIKAKLL